MFKRINEPLIKNGKELFAIGDTCNEIIGDSTNWEKVVTSIWDLKEGDFYWFLDDCGEIVTTMWCNDRIDKNRLSIGNVFLTEEEAEEVSWRRQFETKMRREFKPEECDWNNNNYYKYFVMYDHDDREPGVWTSRYAQIQDAIYCNDEETVTQFIEDNESDLLRYFGAVRR